MSRKKPNPGGLSAAAARPTTATPQTARARPVVSATVGEGARLTGSEASHAGAAALLIPLMMFFAPSVGVPNEEMLQDTLKSIVVAGFALVALMLFFIQQREHTGPLRWHGLLCLPLGLMAWALGSMVWSHAFLGGVEAIRWFVFAVIVWLGLNTFGRERFGALALGIHGGALVASVWTALQFWGDFKVFPQGPNPASTFVNRNFFAEFLVCTLPFSLWLLLRARRSPWIALFSVSLGFNLVAMLMTGTRSALIGLGLLALVLPLARVLYRQGLPTGSAPALSWSRSQRILAAGLLLATVAGLGSIGTGNAALWEEHRAEGRGLTPIGRSVVRVQSMADRREYTERSFSMRWVMWSATARMIAARPLSGVGAGAWEVNIPLHQARGAQLETDYYVHNEILQLLAEYGLMGWAFLLALLTYLAAATWRTWRDHSPQGLAEAPLRAVTLSSLLLLLMVSNAGFPWRLAATGALFAVSLGVLAASDARLGWRWGGALAVVLPWRPVFSRAMLAVSVLCLALYAYISQQAIETESKIVRAVKIALTISQSQQVNSPRWEPMKAEMLQMLRDGIAINPHYRKLTPMVADEAAKWGDWKNATWIWESVAASRPHVVAILSNIARGYSTLGELDKAWRYLERSKALQPDAPAVRSLEVILLSRSSRNGEALALAARAMDQGVYDYDLLSAAAGLGAEQGVWDTALQALALRNRDWPATAVDGWLRIGRIRDDARNPQRDDGRALLAFQQALDLAQPRDKPAVIADVPAAYRDKLQRR